MSWQPIETAPATGTFIVAAWSTIRGAWIVGEAERDPDEPEQFWWANERRDYHADTLINRGMEAKKWQPLPDPPKG